MSAIHTKLTGKEDSYEQAVREAGERESKLREHVKVWDNARAQYIGAVEKRYASELDKERDSHYSRKLKERQDSVCCELDKKINDKEPWHATIKSAVIMPTLPDSQQYDTSLILLDAEKNKDNVFYRIGMDMLSYYKADTETMTPNHPDYMRLVVHQMD